MTRWLRFQQNGTIGFGTLENDVIAPHQGDLFDTSEPTGRQLALDQVTVLTPCLPSKMICLWNNFHQLAAKLEVAEPDEPLTFLKAPNAYLPHGGTIRRPASYSGKVIYEGELGIVIGRTCRAVSEDAALDYVFGYTCVNDVTAVELLKKDPTFDQWTRAKSFDGFGVFGPVIATHIDPTKENVRTVLNGDLRQDYPLSDMIFSPARLVSALSHDMTLLPGDLIACGTSLGVGAMKLPRNQVEISIAGIGTLSNLYLNE